MANGNLSDTMSKLDMLDGVLDIIGQAKAKQQIPSSRGINSAPLQLSKELAALTGDTYNLRPPIKGRIVDCFIDFPTGCRKLVDVKISKNTHDIVPTNGYIALDKPYQTRLNEPITPSDVITIDINNHDSVEAHKITVLLTIIGD